MNMMIKAPECSRCDDTGVVPGNEVFNAALCKCESGATLAAPGLRSMSFDHERGNNAASFVLGAITIDEHGMLYNGVKIEDAGKAYRTLMAVLHDTDPNPDDRPPRLPALDVRLHDMALMIERMAVALAKLEPGSALVQDADAQLVRFGLKKRWPVPPKTFTLERRHDPHNPSNRHNPLNQGRRRGDRE